jgi:shikimate dehydrogenase
MSTPREASGEPLGTPWRGAAAPRNALLLGLIGGGIQASRTPALHEQEAAAQGLRCLYQLIDIDRLKLTGAALGELLTAAERMGFAGVNVTHPCKQAVIPHLHALSDEAEALGAVNVVIFESGRRTGHNTDAPGFAESFRRGLAGVALARVVQIGAGGAGAAVAHAALGLGVGRLTLVDTDAARADALADRLNQRFGAGRAVAAARAEDALPAADGLINATPIGMVGHPGQPVPSALLRPALWVADVIYTPLETALLRSARALGCRTLPGGGMAVFQAVEAFRLFSGRAADAERMLAHFATMG